VDHNQTKPNIHAI